MMMVALLLLGLSACAGPKFARLHGSLKEFGSNNVKMELAGAVGDVSDINAIRIPVNDDGTFDLVVPLEKPTYFQVGRNTLYLTPGDDMEVNLGTSQPQSWFKGQGAEVNTYLKGRLFPKAGSFLEAGRNVKGSFEETKKYIDDRAAQREKELKALPNASKEFVELEMIRIKADVANSYMAYLWYSDLLEDCKTREEGEKIANEFNKSIREYINPLLKEISAKDKYLEVAVVRDVLLSCYEMDASIFDFSKSQRLKELNDTSIIYLFNNIFKIVTI